MSYLKSNPAIWRLALLLALLGAVAALPALAVDKPAGGGPVAQPAPSATPTAAPETPAIPSDPAFGRYADITALGSAWRNLDAAGMTDVGLQLAEGERILFRPHKAITADQVLGMAAKVAVEHRDTATLKRLAKAADALGKKDLAGQVAAAEKATSAPPDPQADHALPVAQTSVAAFQQYKGALARVTAAKLSGDAKALDAIAQAAPRLQGVPEAHRAHVAKVASAARAALPKDANGTDPAAAALNDIATKAGALPPGSTTKIVYPSTSLGIIYINTANGCQVTQADANKVVPFADGSMLQPNDVITRVGNNSCNNLNGNFLDPLIAQAYATGNTQVWVRDINTGNVNTYFLP